VCLIDAVINTRLLPGPERRLVAARRGALKLITQVGPSGRPEPVGQFDLAQDPLEQRDLLEGAGPDRELLAAIVEFLAVDAERARHVTTDGDTSVDAERLQWLREMGYLK
jgi:hypothetical protein